MPYRWASDPTKEIQMKFFIMLLFVSGTLLILTGCKEERLTEVVQTVDWYKANKIERADMMEKCRANPGELALTPNCVNASRAASAIKWGATGGMKPIKPLTFDQPNKN